jgi:protein-tyrosine-phosphatase
MERKQILMGLPSGFEYLNQWYEKFLNHFPHTNRNVFVMMPFTARRTNQIYEAASLAIEHHGLIPLRADLVEFTPALWWNVLIYMIGSAYGIVIYEPKDGIPFNPNVSIEAGFMLGLDRQVLLLSNQKNASLPVDFSGRKFKTFDSRNISETVNKAVSDWIEKDISYFPYGRRKLIIFTSLGGTCRCVMAKAILRDRLERLKIATATVDAAAVADPHHNRISPSAIRVLDEIGCSKWIKDDRPRKLSPYLQDRADLIIALTDSRLARAPDRPEKIITDVDLFGFRITNPYPDKEDDDSIVEYRNSRKQIAAGIDATLEKILDLSEAAPRI